MSSVKIEIVCRACLDDSSKVDLVSIFSDGVLEAFEVCTSLSVTEDDPYPKHLCMKCCGLVNSFSDFRQKCIQSQIDWKSHWCGGAAQNVVATEPSKIPNRKELEQLESDIDNEDCSELLDNVSHSKKQENEYRKNIQKKNKNRIDAEFKGQCEKCKKEFHCKKELTKNVRRCCKEHKPRPVQTVESLFCGICDEKPKTRSELQRHLETHSASSSLDCKTCSYNAVDFADLLVHRYVHRPEGEKCNIFCMKCPRTYRVLSRLEFHYRGVHLKKTRPGVCKQCNKEFTNYNHFMVHLLMHTGKVFECEVCHNTFKYEKSLRKHMVTHSSVKRYMCDLCGYSCHRPGYLRSHHFRRHNKHERTLCHDCGKSFKNSQSLQDHIVRSHTYKNIPCPVCGKLYKRETEMLLHKKWHSDERPYVCDTCGQSYKAKQQLKIHMRVHTGERPYKCKICEMSFTQGDTLKKHTLIHTGERPHVCTTCGKKFAAKSNMKKHQQRHKVTIGKVS